MRVHWTDLKAHQKVEVIKMVWQEGMSASDIAKRIPGATRRAVIGLYFRNRDKMADHRLLPAYGGGVPVEKRFRSEKRRAATRPWLRVVDEPELLEPRGVSLVDLGPHECKWPINDAPPGGTHLFCGAAAEGSYCEVHSRLAYKSIDQRERKRAA